MKTTSRWLLLVTAALTLVGCAARPAATQAGEPTTEAGGTLNVFAAASLKAPFDTLAVQFEAEHPGWDVVLNLAGSQQLAQQINSDAPVDIFASANQAQLDAVISGGQAAEGSGQIFARNRLVIVTPADNPAGLETPADLAQAGIKLVLAAEEVPVGKYSLEVLDQAGTLPDYGPGFRERVLANVVSYEDNVKAVLSKVALGEADAGIVYVSDTAGGDGEKVVQIPIPDDINSIAVYPIAVLSNSQSRDMAQAFVSLVLSEEGQRVLSQAGFLSAED